MDKTTKEFREIDRIVNGKTRGTRLRPTTIAVAIREARQSSQLDPSKHSSFENRMIVLDVHRVILPWNRGGEYVICLHMQKVVKVPVEGPFDPRRPWLQDMIYAFQTIGHNDQRHATVEANVFLTPDEFEEWGRPFPGQAINITFRPEKK